MKQTSLGLKLRVLRAERGLSMTEAAEKAGIQRQTLAFAERGERRPHDVTLSRLAQSYGVPIEELLEDPVPLEETPKTGQGIPREKLMSRPEVQEWLLEHGHTTEEEFLSLVEELSTEDEVDAAGEELKETRDALIEGLKDRSVKKALFGPVRPRDFEEKKARMGEAIRPVKLARMLEGEIRGEYSARRTALANYSRELFLRGEAESYLVWEPLSEGERERHRERHELLLDLKERRRVLKEKYAAQLAMA
jgi:transcriptional regulator with XRE-family HTH domain